MTDFSPATFGPPAVRVGTAEREQAAEALGKHFAAGRLDLDEYDDRVGRAYAAKTTDELTILFADLPQPAPAPTPPPTPHRRDPRLLLPAIGLAGVLAFATAFVLATHIVPFFIFPLLFFVVLRGRRFGHHNHYGPRSLG
ncbi:DUF1707 SHOCT-like domain-containing protein [Nocardia sp. NBC_01327]|uniref:DUF1707 SHOCT-like domain-containing protein n=1 Tax=Nocardia sp. NBC_01327 TaxID=2903593 RepID=UPI002E0F8DCD|nr:DUF1707 domain-containing protein [Nocardia sp. NBC_01327]